MSAPRLLVIGDAGVNSGFERGVRGICDAIADRGRFDVTVRGIGYNPARSTVAPYRYAVKPTFVDDADPIGFSAFGSWLAEDRPDAVLFVQDPWNVTKYLASARADVPTTAWLAVDSPNVKWSYALGLGAITRPAVWTHFAAGELAEGVRDAVDRLGAQALHNDCANEPLKSIRTGKDALRLSPELLGRAQNPAHYSVVPYGHTPGQFGPMQKRWCREKLDLAQQAFIVLAVGTNSIRKRLDLTLRAFAGFAAHAPNALLVIHCAGGEGNGLDLQQLADYLGIGGKVRLVHRREPDLNDETLNWLYNAADVQLSTSGGEGWGVPVFEGAACGVPQIVPHYSATGELWQAPIGASSDYAYLAPVIDVRYEAPLNTAHGVVDIDDVAGALRLLYDDEEYRALLGRCALERAGQQLTWPSVGARMEELLVQSLLDFTMLDQDARSIAQVAEMYQG